MKITENCTGCGACASSCPWEAITMKPDASGFLCASIDASLCVKCQKCIRLCPQNSIKAEARNVPERVLGAVHKDKSVLMKSASGAAFYAIAESFLEDGGVVAGAAWDQSQRAVHILCTKKEDLSALQGSKYVQSDTTEIYHAVGKCLEQGKNVLFSGTPCQIAGVRKKFGMDCKNLFTLDLICHGVTSPLLLKEYLKEVEQQAGASVTHLAFRNKENQKNPFQMKMELSDGRKILKSNLQSWYYYCFLRGSMYRDCCYDCHYAREERISDITIGDFWGVQKYYDVHTDKGFSAILVNTENGKRILSHALKNMEWFEAQLSQVKETNQQLDHPSPRPESSQKLLESLQHGDIAAIKRAYRKESFPGRVKTYILKVLGR